MLLSEKSQSKNATYFTIPTIKQIWKRQPREIVKRSVVDRGQWEERNAYVEHRGSLGQQTILCDTIVVDTGNYTFVQTHIINNIKDES